MAAVTNCRKFNFIFVDVNRRLHSLRITGENGDVTLIDAQRPLLEVVALPQLGHNLLAMNVRELVTMRFEKSDAQ
jgi:hypothetical protein